ncbi:MAG: sugar ABC transporter permease [Trueperaceae bacterium]|nr:sugar ABC transporter permease [Trueperaceae bacterium]
MYGFIGRTAWVSLTNWGADASQALALNPKLEFIGFANYDKLFTSLIDTRFRQDLVNTFFFTIFFLLGCLVLGLGLAILLDQKVRFEGLFRTIFLFPFALAFIVTGTVWRWMLQPQGGVNVLPELVGLPRLTFPWVTTRQQIWQFDWNSVPAFFAGAAALVLLWLAWRAWRSSRRTRAGVHGRLGPGPRRLGPVGHALASSCFPIPRRTASTWPSSASFSLPYGRCRATRWRSTWRACAASQNSCARPPASTARRRFQVYRHVILPMLGPITLSAMIILGHISLKIFDLIWAMAGADNATTDVPALLMYLRSFRANRFAEGAAIAIVLLIMVATVIIPYLRASLKGEVER